MDFFLFTLRYSILDRGGIIFLLFVVAFDRLEPRVDRDFSKGGTVGFVTFSILNRILDILLFFFSEFFSILLKIRLDYNYNKISDHIK